MLIASCRKFFPVRNASDMTGRPCYRILAPIPHKAFPSYRPSHFCRFFSSGQKPYAVHSPTPVIDILRAEYRNPVNKTPRHPGARSTPPHYYFHQADILRFPCYPRRVRHSRTLPTKSGTCFNPRTREGCDQQYHPNLETHSMFQSTHPRGVRHYSATNGATIAFNVSIHAPARGATPTGSSPSKSTTFQSTHPRGVRLS